MLEVRQFLYLNILYRYTEGHLYQTMTLTYKEYDTYLQNTIKVFFVISLNDIWISISC